MVTKNRAARKRRTYTGLLAVQGAAIVMGAAFLLIGILGFTPGVTAHLDSIQLVGYRSGALLFDVFQVSVVQNLSHVAFGIVGLLLARSYAMARAYLLIGGLLFLGLWIWGLLMHPVSAANVLPINNADNWLHLGLGVTMTVLALTLAGARVPTGAGGEELVPPPE
ncbi:DUF4383 domain-containing protein [Mycolicibacterium komossense]|uniref:DUF4383 domain-containing protein n=1 Tax=Mycolicibacterium komossense TaxID=1779 RepID=A0ABT3CEC5_9MYCO|nr:DUF4383 domain-containing protein [Mycolicibacterium komossense]MCV7227830.1 DUF4383 domain-containing protein [Mycolicibacterium komossense]